MAALLRRPIVYDFDDAIYRLHTSAVNRWFGWLKFPGKTSAICRLSSHVTVGNSFLAEYVRQYNRNITVIPSSIDTELYRPIDRNGQKQRVTIGWTGSSTSQTHFGTVRARSARASSSASDCELRVISDRRPILPDVPATWRPWSPQTEAEEVGQFDIGIMPMPDDPWARGKCAFKALQYMAMEASRRFARRSAPNSEVVQHGVNGLLPKTPEDWLGELGRLIDNEELRRRLGAAGRQTVEQKYSMRNSASLLAQVIRSVVRA